MRHKAWLIKKVLWLFAIIIVVFVLIALPFIINSVYMEGAADENVKESFTSGDILSFYGAFLAFSGTVGLGFLALWQNKRLVALNSEANHQNVVNKIIEIESKRLECLEIALDAYTAACDPQKIWEIKYEMTPSNNNTNSNSYCLDKAILLVHHRRLIRDEFYRVTRAFKLDEELIKKSSVPLIISFSNVYFGANDFLDLLDKEAQELCMGKYLENMNSLSNTCFNSFSEFLAEKEKYLAMQNQKLDRLLYGSIPLSEIKKIYKKESDILK